MLNDGKILKYVGTIGKSIEEREVTVTIGKPKKQGWAPGAGFKVVETLTLEEAINNNEYRIYALKMIQQIKKLYQIIKNITGKYKKSCF